MPENTENVTPEGAPTNMPDEIPTDGGVSIPEGLREVDPAKLAEIRAKLAAFMVKSGTTVSGSEDPDSSPAEQPMGGTEGDKPVGRALSGADVDWSEYDLDYSIRHLYTRASFRDTQEGPKWVAMLDEFYSTARSAKQHGKMVNVPGSNDKTMSEPLNLGEYLTQMVNGPEGWNIAAILPGSMDNALVILRKQAPYILPDPRPLKKMEEVEAPRDEELVSIETAALEFAAEEGLTPPPVEEDTGVEADPNDLASALDSPTEDLSSRFLPPGSVELEEGTGAIPVRDSKLISRAIGINRPETLPPPVPSGIQPPPIDPHRGSSGEGFVGSAGVENIRVGLRNLLDNDALPDA